jgi:hypothetical protein
LLGLTHLATQRGFFWYLRGLRFNRGTILILDNKYRNHCISADVRPCYDSTMADRFREIQERIECILVLLKATKKFENRARLLRDMRILLDKADKVILQRPLVESSQRIRQPQRAPTGDSPS